MRYNVYKMEGTNAKALLRALEMAKELVAKRSQENFHSLLSKEIENLVDGVALNEATKPENVQIIDAAFGMLINKIRTASANNYITEYNFNVKANVYIWRKNSYIEVATMQDDLYGAVGAVPNFRDYSCVSGIDDETNTAKRAELNGVITDYKNRSPLCYSLSYFSFGKPDFEDLSFSEPEVRIQKRARYRLTSQYLSMYAGGGNVEPNKLMSCLDDALIKLSDEKSKDLLEDYERTLRQIIIPITKEIVFGAKPKAEEAAG